MKKRTAVLLIDMQETFVGCLRAGERKRIVPNQIAVLRRCIRDSVPVFVIETKGEGSTIEELQEILEHVPDCTYVLKTENDGFDRTNLEVLLKERGVESLVVMGINADYCVLETAETAAHRGFDIITGNDLISGMPDHTPDNSESWYRENGRWVAHVAELL